MAGSQVVPEESRTCRMQEHYALRRLGGAKETRNARSDRRRVPAVQPRRWLETPGGRQISQSPTR